MVDDCWENRSVLREFLASLGFEVVEAENGQQALGRLNERQPDLIIVDLVMPVMDGFQFLEIVQRDSLLAISKIIVSSASVSLADHQLVRDRGVDAFLPKPVDFTVLLNMLEEKLNLQWQYEKLQEKSQTKTTNSSMLLPPREVLEMLLNYSEEGLIMKLNQAIEAMVGDNPELAEFANSIIPLSTAFKVTEVEDLLSQYIQKQI